jgi:uncharacterized membrane protein YfcA
MHGVMQQGAVGLYTLAGLLVGLLVGLTGVGGGAWMTPLLILLFGVHPVTAVGTDLLQAAATKSVGTAVHGLSRNVEWRITGLLACGSVPATAVTVLGLSFRTESAASHLVSLLLGIAIILTAVALLFRRALLRLSSSRLAILQPRRVAQLTIASGLVLGVLVTITSIGAGALGVIALTFLYPTMPTQRIVAGLLHWWLGTIDWPLLGYLLLGSVPGIVIGSLVATQVPEGVLRPVLAGVLLLAGGRLLG